jgi:6-pyruvoyltetrahydropterin/6-carboxytetrahydropterin synthase
MPYQSTKRYGHEVGLSCAFRQWRANSHCKLIHGYALSFKFVFETEHLDARNWVINFGGLKSLKSILEDNFDHKLLISKDDPQIDEICALAGIGVANVLVVDRVGCEAFAYMGFMFAQDWLRINNIPKHVRVVSCEVAEHGANSALYIGE